MSITKKMKYQLMLRKYRKERDNWEEEMDYFTDIRIPNYGKGKLEIAYQRWCYYANMCKLIENLLKGEPIFA